MDGLFMSSYLCLCGGADMLKGPLCLYLLSFLSRCTAAGLVLTYLIFWPHQIRLIRGDFVDESGCPVPDWVGFIRAARNGQEQNLEAVSDLPGGQVNFFHPLTHKPSGVSELVFSLFTLRNFN